MSKFNIDTRVGTQDQELWKNGQRGERLRAIFDRKKRYFFFKRMVDIIFSLLVSIFVLSWLVPLVGLAIRLNSSGPVIFRQRRVGRGGKIFTCYKFRTMIVNQESDFIQSGENDYRITRVGKFLRKTNLDEFPQFINVLLGRMSLVGPRPHMLSDCHNFSSLVPGYKFRNFVKPGITGMAQIKGFHGPTADFESIFRRYQWDAFYVRNSSLWLDLRIIRQTVFQSADSLIRNLFLRTSMGWKFKT